MSDTKKVVMNTDVTVPIGSRRSRAHYSAGLYYEVPPEIADEWIVRLLARLPGEDPPRDSEDLPSGRALRLERLKQESLEHAARKQEQHDTKKAAVKQAETATRSCLTRIDGGLKWQEEH